MTGFLAGSKVKANGALNAGLRKYSNRYHASTSELISYMRQVDQEFALKWVQQHVAMLLNL